MVTKRVVAIIGLGPRGMHAMERLLYRLANLRGLKGLQLLLFDRSENPGSGAIYDPGQPKSNWMNLSERALDIPQRPEVKGSVEIPYFPSYHEWIGKNFNEIHSDEEDYYPPRAKVGHYLTQRFATIYQSIHTAGLASLYQEKIIRIEESEDRLKIETLSGKQFMADEILLTTGHQPTRLSAQMDKWVESTNRRQNLHLFVTPYPVEQFFKSNQLNPRSKIAIRGFGLAMIDVVRTIAEKFGNFTVDEETHTLIYQSDLRLTDLLFPFSTNGLPMAPKPVSSVIDQWFLPSASQLDGLGEKIGDPVIQAGANSSRFLVNAIVKIVVEVYSKLPSRIELVGGKEEIEHVARRWLENEGFQHRAIISQDQPPQKSISDFIRMGLGMRKISLDYCIGQVWRHCQPVIHDCLSFNQCTEEVFAQIIDLDERMKRYAYGPPVRSMQQLLAMEKAGVLRLDMVNNPEIELTDKGWVLRYDGKSTTTDIMIDSVLDPPDLEKVGSPLFRSILQSDQLKVDYDNMGIKTGPDSYMLSTMAKTRLSIALLGRHARGTALGVDSILRCFGLRADLWAKTAASNHIKWLKHKL